MADAEENQPSASNEEENKAEDAAEQPDSTAVDISEVTQDATEDQAPAAQETIDSTEPLLQAENGDAVAETEVTGDETVAGQEAEEGHAEQGADEENMEEGQEITEEDQEAGEEHAEQGAVEENMEEGQEITEEDQEADGGQQKSLIDIDAEVNDNENDKLDETQEGDKNEKEEEEEVVVVVEPEQQSEDVDGGEPGTEAQLEEGEDDKQDEQIVDEGKEAEDFQQEEQGEVLDIDAIVDAEKDELQDTVEEEKEQQETENFDIVTPAQDDEVEAEAQEISGEVENPTETENGDVAAPGEGEVTEPEEEQVEAAPEEAEVTPPEEAEATPPEEGAVTPAEEAEVATPEEGEVTPPEDEKPEEMETEDQVVSDQQKEEEGPQDEEKQVIEDVPASDQVSREQPGDVTLEDQQQPAENIESAMLQEKSDIQESALGAPPSTAEESGIPPAPHLPSPDRSYTHIEGQMSTSALNIVWSFGLNRNVPVLNLSDGVREAIMYPCAHVGIMYDFKNNKQHTLQAHLNPITCSAVSHDKRWLVTGDVGPDAMVNIWDTYTGIPIQTMFDPNAAGGVVAVALTPDSRYLATLSALPVQTLAIWDWTVDGDVPICSADLKPEYGVQNFIYFDPTDIHHVVTNSATQVLFFHWADNAMHYFAPPLTDSDFNKPVGRYSQSLFQIGIARALTATSIGNLVVWDNNKPLSKFMDVNQSADKKPLKIIKVHDKGINVLTTTDEYIVLGDMAGHVKFFDQGLRLIYWYQDFNSGPCTALSFAYMPDFEPVATENSKYPSDATKQAKAFIVRNFVVGTAIAVYGNVTTDGSKFKVIHREHDAAVHALAAHPKLPVIAIGSYSGLLKLWNYKLKETVASRMFEKVHIQTIVFDKKGLYIVVGCTNGTVFLVDSVALLDQLSDPYRYARDTITHIAFSHNSTYFATADAGYTVTVFKRLRKDGRSHYQWHGRYRSHYKPIRDLLFDVYLDTNEPKLLSLGEDKMLIEYELNNPGKNHVIPRSEDRIEQFSVPQCMCLYPPITKEHFLFTANDEYKLKCYNSTTKMCRKTVLGPTYGSPIIKMMVVPTTADESSNRLLAYITNDKIGLHLLPANGNPHLAMALIAHPSGVSNLACSSDGKYLFTAGGPDYAVHMWEINVPALEAQAKLGGDDLIPFYGLLEGGRDGEMFAELEDLFYYAQLRHQGINSMDTREIGNRVPISEVPFIMRAMGFYPSEQEIEDMLNEIKYDDFVNSGQYQEDIDLGQFIKLYVNHRPAFGLAPEKLLWAFQTLAESPELGKGGVIERGDLLDILQKNGEHMTEIELAEHLSTLLGYNREGGSCEQEPFDAEGAGNLIAENLPYDINAEILVNEILGFSLTVDPPGQDDSKDVVKSGATIF